jgi:hypothetical protein
MASIKARLDWQPAQAAALADMAKDVRKATVRAMRNAGDKAGRALVTASVAYVRSRKNLKSGFIRSQLTLKRPGRDAELVWTMKATSPRPVSLAQYPHTVTKRGVRVRVNKGGGKLLTGAFPATVGAGHRGIFIRKGNGKLPIKQLLSSRLTDVLQDEGKLQELLAKSREIMRVAFDAGLVAQLAKLKR